MSLYRRVQRRLGLSVDWSQTSAIMAMIHNVNCSKKSEMKSPNEYFSTSSAIEANSRLCFLVIFGVSFEVFEIFSKEKYSLKS